VALLATLCAALALSAAGALLGSDGLRVYALVARYHRLLAGCALLGLATALAVLFASARGRYRRWLLLAVAVAGLATQAGGLNAGPLLLAVATGGLGWWALRTPTGAWGLWSGALGLGVLLALVLVIIAPGAAPLVLFPALLGAAGAAAVFAAGARERWAQAALVFAAALAAVAFGWLCGWASGLFAAAGPMLPALLAPFALLTLFTAAPFARWFCGLSWAPAASGVLALAGVALLAQVGLAGPTAARPRPTQAQLIQEAGRPARLVAPAPQLDPWTRSLLGKAERGAMEPVFPRPVWSSAAPSGLAGLAQPQLEAVREGDRLIVRSRASGPARRLSLWLRSDAALANPRLNARNLPLALKPGRWARLDVHAPPPEGFALSLEAPEGAIVEVVVTQLVDGWPKGVTPAAPPAGYMPVGDSGSTLAITRRTLRP
jgi:hypothetical protein